VSGWSEVRWEDLRGGFVAVEVISVR